MPENLYWLEIVFLLLGILVACETFTNAIENLGERLNLNHEFTGSILAAVGTALPETILPLVAIYMATKVGAAEAATKNDIAIGAIVGAPFMLATLAMFLLGLSIWLHRKSRGSSELKVNKAHLERDLKFFLKVFSIAILATVFSTYYQARIVDYICSSELGIRLLSIFKFGEILNQCDDSTSIIIRSIIAIIIIAFYIFYLIETYKASSSEFSGEDSIDDCPVLYLTRFIGLKTSMLTVVVQTLMGLAGIIYFAHGFVHGVERVSDILDISPLVLSLIISPIATELPEKVNSWIWSSQGKDTLAMGNISGAMVFQASIPCVIGILLTPWVLTKVVLLCASLAIISTIILVLSLKLTNKISYKTLLFCGSLYLIYLGLVFIL